MRTLTFVLMACALCIPRFAFAADAPSADTAAKQLKESPRHGEWVDIAMPGSETKLHTWVVYPETKEKAGVVIVIHEIFGATDWIRSVADALAAEGFIAVAPDMLSGMGPDGGGTDVLGEKVRDEIRKLKPEDIALRLNAAREWALKQPSASGKSGCIGFCWGGTASFNYATVQPALNGAVVYYGSGPKLDEAMSKIACPVIGFYGGDDARVTSTVEPSKQAMKKLDKKYDANVYEGAGHGFLRQQSGKDGANERAAKSAWADTIAFFKKQLSS